MNIMRYSQYKKFKIIFSKILTESILSFWHFDSHRDYSILNKSSHGETIVMFGDSLAKGYGSTGGNDLSESLSRKIKFPIINSGRNGDTTKDALSRMYADVLSKNPKIVIVLLAGNDYLHKVPKEEIFGNLSKIIEKIQNAGAAVILVEVRGRLIVGSYGKEFEKLARQHRASLVSDVTQGFWGKDSYMHDTIHPNNLGYQIMSERIYPTLVELL